MEVSISVPYCKTPSRLRPKPSGALVRLSGTSQVWIGSRNGICQLGHRLSTSRDLSPNLVDGLQLVEPLVDGVLVDVEDAAELLGRWRRGGLGILAPGAEELVCELEDEGIGDVSDGSR